MHFQWPLCWVRPRAGPGPAGLGRGHASSRPQDREVQPKYSSKGPFLFLFFNLELCDRAGSCRGDGNIFKALFSCPNNPNAAEMCLTHA